MRKNTSNLLNLLIHIAIGCIMLIPLLWPTIFFGIDDTFGVIENIVTEIHANDAYAIAAQWILITYIFALPAYGAFTIYSAVVQYRKTNKN